MNDDIFAPDFNGQLRTDLKMVLANKELASDYFAKIGKNIRTRRHELQSMITDLEEKGNALYKVFDYIDKTLGGLENLLYVNEIIALNNIDVTEKLKANHDT